MTTCLKEIGVNVPIDRITMLAAPSEFRLWGRLGCRRQAVFRHRWRWAVINLASSHARYLDFHVKTTLNISDATMLEISREAIPGR